MSKSKMSSTRSSEKAEAPARRGRPRSDKPRPVTQSTRFTPEQMELIGKACEAKGWSVAQFLLVAALEKAVATTEMQDAEKKRLFRDAARTIAQGFIGSFPEIWVRGERLGNPEDPRDPKNWGQWRVEEEGKVSPFLRATFKVRGEDGDSMDFGYDPNTRRLYFDVDMLLLHEGGEPWLRMNPKPVAGSKIHEVIACIRVLSPEVSDLIKEAYLEATLEGSSALPEIKRMQGFLRDF